MQLLIFFFVAVLSLSPSSFTKEFTDNEFKMPVLLLMLITLLNDGTLITIGYDNVVASPYPCVWNTKVLFFISLMLGTIAWVSNFLVLWAALDSHSPTSILARLGVEPLNYGQITTLVYMKVSITDFLTLFSSRGGEGFFWEIRPAGMLLGGAFFALGLSTTLALVWPKGTLDDCDIEGLVHSPGNQKMMALWCWVFCILCWFLQDLLKVICYKVMRTWNLLGIADDTHMTEDLLNSYSSSMDSKNLRSKSSVFAAGAHASRDRMVKGSLNH
jgi:H+-transporting ATPase